MESNLEVEGLYSYLSFLDSAPMIPLLPQENDIRMLCTAPN
jgi:hypothetical protein